MTQIQKLGSRARARLSGDHDTSVDYQRIARELSNIVSLSNKIYPSNNLSRVVNFLGLAVNVASIGQHLYGLNQLRKVRGCFTLRIAESDRSFSIAERWLEESMTEEQTRSSFLHTQVKAESSHLEEWDDTSAALKRKVKLNLRFDGSFRQEIEVAGHKVIISTTVPENQGAANERKKLASGYLNERTINFSCPSIEARTAVIEALAVEAQRLAQSPPVFFTAMKWGGFRTISDIPKRSTDSVVLKEGQMERIIAFLKRFLDNEEVYTRLGVPYRTGMLLHGTPGSGKTSTATAIAYELGLNICYVQLTALDDDDALTRALGEVPPRSIIVLEDVDVYRAMQDRSNFDHTEDGKSGVTMAGLLNALDGALAPHGTITVMTTNHVDKLDPAVIRPGRVDLTEEIDELDSYQLRRLCEIFIGSVPEDLPDITPADGITSAQVLGVIRDHIPDVELSGPSITKFVKGKLEEFTKTAI